MGLAMTARDELDKLDREWLEQKERHSEVPRLQRLGSVGGISMYAGFGLVALGLWLNDLGEDVRLERLLHPWPTVCIVLGLCVTVGSMVLTIGYVNPRIRAFCQARCGYDNRREELLQEIYAAGQDLKNADADRSS